MQLARPDSDERRGRGCLKLATAEILNWLAAKMIEPSHRILVPAARPSLVPFNVTR